MIPPTYSFEQVSHGFSVIISYLPVSFFILRGLFGFLDVP
jgi:hypothetical protein